MSLKNVDIESALRRLADRRIEDAMKEGKFDNLPGAGAPLELEPMPAEENARLMWWTLRILKQNNVTPHEVQWRKALDYLKAQLERLTDESRLETVVTQINDLVYKLNTLGTNAINLPVVGVELEQERQRLRDRLAGNS
jgi:DnaJ homologue, subfamily C, member 28, conserved domain